MNTLRDKSIRTIILKYQNWRESNDIDHYGSPGTDFRIAISKWMAPLPSS
jgi:hypothetical protein